MANNWRDYFFPRRGLHHIPKHISAEYERGNITKQQAILMIAGMARDPQHAENVYQDLLEEHGRDVWDYVEFHVRRKRTGSFGERLMRLMRRIFGEQEHQNTRTRTPEPIVNVNFVWSRDDDIG